MTPRPFRIEVPDAVLADLRERLARTRWPEPLTATPAGTTAPTSPTCGSCAPTGATATTGARWEARLNALPAFRPRGRRHRHPLHPRPRRGPTPMPLLIIHGWPGSIVEFLELIGPLTDPARARRRSGRRVRRRRALAARLRLLRPPRDRGWGVGADRGRVRPLMRAARLRALRRPGRRLGRDRRRVLGAPHPDASPAST